MHFPLLRLVEFSESFLFIGVENKWSKKPLGFEGLFFCAIGKEFDEDKREQVEKVISFTL